ncbi:MAG TPA: AAA family ATPase [Devosia sp.]
MARQKTTTLPPPFLRRISLPDGAELPKRYPFDLPWLAGGDFEVEFTEPVTIIIGENGSGKSTLIEAIAGHCGYDEAGGGKGYRPVDHSGALDQSGAALGDMLRAAWLPKITTGWFFKSESFFDVARYLDRAALEGMGAPPDFLSLSHGEGFMRFFGERLGRQGIYFLDEPESALSPRRQLQLVAMLTDIQARGASQVIMATHSPILMATPGATLLEIGHRGLKPVSLTQTDTFRLYQEFIVDPEETIRLALRELEGEA